MDHDSTYDTEVLQVSSTPLIKQSTDKINTG
jgi:hypothetical protein